MVKEVTRLNGRYFHTLIVPQVKLHGNLELPLLADFRLMASGSAALRQGSALWGFMRSSKKPLTFQGSAGY
jgi:hypothetical protein